jgi:acyl-lipid omega-6 desaturase (Delta-12 desaturase)
MSKKSKPVTGTSANNWREIVARYQTPSISRSAWQLVNSFVPYFIMWYLMWLSLKVSYWLTLGLAVLAAGFLIRIFIIFHDCGHNSFFKSQKLNDFWGIITGLLTFTPYYHWRHDHAVHHATAGNLDRRGVGDVKTITVQEYLALPPLQKFIYRVFRNPFVMFTIGASIVFLVGHRFYRPTDGKREKRSVIWTNLALAGIIALMSVLIGFKTYVAIQLPIIMMAATAGVWLFYVQHNFEGTYWARSQEWDYAATGLQGSSFYKLPKVLQWFTGNIGFHHIHHLSPRTPNYLLEKCHRENPYFEQVRPLTIGRSLKSLFFRLWDEEHQKMVGFGVLKLSKDKP